MTQDLKVVVRLLGEPTLWSWELRDVVTGALVESSWSSCWMAFETREQARADGLRRLAEIVCPGGHVDHARVGGRRQPVREAVPPAA
ncbi:MAG: hypothetical protein HYU51_08165 [Candidatus Rokubacteria bacterium]|nr:hypothetical protein [Candidatus Rokubacteria bacterium]